MATVPQSNSEAQRYNNLIKDFGRLGAHALFPNDFEAYFVSLELTDSNGITEKFITFPVSPDNISETTQNIINIKKSNSGVVAIESDGFIPSEIEIKGSFGKLLRFSIGKNILQGGAISVFRSITEGNIERPSFSTSVKSGYGYIKALENICNSSRQLDANGKPKKLFLYNTILGNNYLVKVRNFTHSQNISENTIPKYSLNLTSIAPFTLETRFSDTLDLFPRLDQAIEKVGNTIRNTLGL